MKNPLWKQPGLDRLICVTVASVGLFLVQIVMSHVTHSLTLLVAAYHMLYNIFSLLGCIATIKMCQRGSSLSNTFGWARLEVLSTVVNLLFLFALDFSLVVEAVQTLIHSDHMDSMHRPDIICIVAGVGIILNFTCIILIGGYTHHQGSFLALTPAGDVVVPHGTATEDAVRRGLRRLSYPDRPNRLDCADANSEGIEETETDAMVAIGKKADTKNNQPTVRVSQRWPTFRSVFRDNASTVIALISAIVVYLNGESFTSLVIDPILTIVSVFILAITSYPFIVQAGQILLQTTPAHIDVAELKMKLKRAFPCVINIHDLHVWALTPDRVISTAHLVFMNESVYLQVKEPINKFFLDQGITRVTLQPEFNKFGNLTPAPSKSCVLTCNEENCKSRTCCNYQRVDVVPVEDVESSAHDHQHCTGKHSPSSRNVAAVVVNHSEVISVVSVSFLEENSAEIQPTVEHHSHESCCSEYQSNKLKTTTTLNDEETLTDNVQNEAVEKTLDQPD